MATAFLILSKHVLYRRWPQTLFNYNEAPVTVGSLFVCFW